MSPGRVLALAPALLLLLLISATAAAPYGDGCGNDGAGVGESCLTTPCSHGLKCSVLCGNGDPCDGSVAVCAALPKEGEKCLSFAQQETDISQNCAPGLACAFWNVCTRQPTAGEACSLARRAIGCADGLVCVDANGVGESGNGICQSSGAFAGAGESCLTTPCSKGLKCSVPCGNGDACDGSVAVCAALPKEGEKCLSFAQQETDILQNCAPGLACAFWNVCTRQPTAGEACSLARRAIGCADGLVCVDVNGVGESGDGVCKAA